MTERIAAIVLAAGHSKRMGRPKPFLPYRGTTFLGAILDALHGAGISRPIVVANPAHRDLYTSGAAPGAEIVYNPQVDDGMLSSLRLGLAHADPAATHAMLCLADMPEIGAGTVKAIVAACEVNPGRIVVASHGGRRGHPVAFPREMFDALAHWGGPEGARGFLEAHAGAVMKIELPDPAVQFDVDTPGEFEQLRRRQNEFGQ